MIDSDIRGEFVQINNKLDALDKAIRGNGRPGLQERMSKVEDCMSSTKKLNWLILTAIVMLLANILVAVAQGGMFK